jgi:hypothetical protein
MLSFHLKGSMLPEQNENVGGYLDTLPQMEQVLRWQRQRSLSRLEQI